ncbi:DNA processing protein [Muriicola jejuensis]|uniref:DNA-protecting protein DprA n=1 Tax=Muriicola jejuensis TaxID=504488 RepID=A0A6P0UA09_9FLAO|nr:DNA-processing protein DprA [Muriicola jejuensis]NER09867.1 DNA-protecting protein DprA [Muriicola jejuensis]SMP05124.1 DNA processing protein [Muriicola jejuensis]
MRNEEVISLLRLQAIPNIGEISARKLILRCGSAEEVFGEKRSTLLKLKGIGKTITHHLYDSRYQRMAEKELRFASEQGIEVIPFSDDRYPPYLNHCPDAPLILFTRGHIDLKGKKVISIVGTRNMTRQGGDFCRRIVQELKSLDPVIVSGFAYGVDISVHRAAVESGLQTIACLAHGLNQIYPRAHERYCRSMEKNGGFLTEFWSDSKPEKNNFLKRNRIIAGMSAATVVIESAEKGGSLVTAEMANGYNRDVFAVPGRPEDQFSTGTNHLIRTQKAHLLTSAADLIYHLNWDLEESPPSGIQKKLFVQLDSTEQKVLAELERAGKSKLDDIAMKSGLAVGRTASVLLSLEMKGVVRPLPGKYFEPI